MNNIERSLNIAVAHLTFSLKDNTEDLKVVHQAQRELEQLKQHLKEIEFIELAQEYEPTYSTCVVCGGLKEEGKHADDCWIAKVIKGE